MPLLLLVCLCILTLCHAGAQVPGVRSLADFTNDDGSRPDGADDGSDDSSALRKALAEGPGMVMIDAGTYRFSEVTVPAGVTLAGTGPGTVIRPAAKGIVFRQEGVRDWTIRDLTIDGGETGDWRERTDQGQVGIRILRCSHFLLADVTVVNFAGTGVDIERTGATTPITHGGNIRGLTVRGNRVGVRFGVRAEYINATGLCCENNVTGCIVNAGNAKITDSNIISNLDGLVLEDGDNGSHGIISNCLLNHNNRYALLAREVKSGMVVSGCCFFYGSILLENATGVTITDGLIGCSVLVRGEGINRIAGNRIFPATAPEISISPATLVRDNYGPDGPWEPDRR